MNKEYDSGRAVYLQIKERIREDIINGVYGSGQRLPGVRDLAFAAQVNPNTMQRALVELEAEGMVVTRGTSGRFVTDDGAAIETAKQKMLAGIAAAYLEKLRKFNIGKAEAVVLIEKAAAQAADNKEEA